MAGANFSTIAMPDTKSFFPIGGTRGLLASDSVAKRSSWNMLRLYGLRRDVYLNAKKW